MEHASVMDMLPEEELVVCGQRGQAEAGDSGVGVGLYVAHCAACGRRFEYHGSMYRYRLDVKNRDRLFCSYGCMRRMERQLEAEREETHRKRQERARLWGRSRKKEDGEHGQRVD